MAEVCLHHRRSQRTTGTGGATQVVAAIVVRFVVRSVYVDDDAVVGVCWAHRHQCHQVEQCEWGDPTKCGRVAHFSLQWVVDLNPLNQHGGWFG